MKRVLSTSLLVVAFAATPVFASMPTTSATEVCPVEKMIHGKKSTSEVVLQLKELVRNEACLKLNNVCELRGEGDVSGVWKQHRIFLNNSPIVGSNDLDGLMENVNELRASGICQE